MKSEYMDVNLKAPFPYFGGKGLITHIVWEYLGDPKQYIEPFCGSAAMLLSRPQTRHKKMYEIINDADGFVSNVWRAIKLAPDEVAKWCDWPINHADLVARKSELLKNEEKLLENLCKDPEWCDAKLAGYWVWAASCWIGSGLTRPNQRPRLTGDQGIHSQRPRLTGDQGIHSQRPHLTGDQGIHSQIPHLTGDKGIHSQIPYLDNRRKILERDTNIYEWMRALSARLRYVKVVCGDWTRVCGGNWQNNNSPVGIFFDPPYATSFRDKNIYHKESLTIAKDVESWCLERGSNKDYRIVAAGYEDEYKILMDNGWFCEKWRATGGYSTPDNPNRHRERLFISPHCIKMGLFQ